jgi:hypothetical protein
MKAKLKKCPFCGGNVIKVYSDIFYQVECNNCHCSTSCYVKYAWAVKAWNRRVR